MEVHYITNHGYIDHAAIVPQVKTKLLTADQRKVCADSVGRLDRLWDEVSRTCPRECAEQVRLAKLATEANPLDDAALERYRGLAAETPAFINARHANAHARFNAAAFELAPLAITALRAFRAELVQRAGKVRSLWGEIVEVFPRSFNDIMMNDTITGRLENTLRSIDERLAQLLKPAGTEAHVVLSDLGQLDIAATTRQCAGGDYHDPAHLAAAEAAASATVAPIKSIDGGKLELA